MLNRYPVWKYLLILLVLGISIIYALPNLYPADPAVQISKTRNHLIDDPTVKIITDTLAKADIGVKQMDRSGTETVLVRLKYAKDQLNARSVIKDVLGNDYVVALNLASTTPSWLRKIGAKPMNLGLDLSGGVHFLLQVDMKKALQTRLNVYSSEVRAMLRKQQIRYRSVDVKGSNQQALGFKSPAQMEKAKQLIRDKFPELQLEDAANNAISYSLNTKSLKDIKEYAIKQNLTTIRNRVNELGVSEPVVQRQGSDRIVVELPGIQDTAQAKRIIGKTANLEFRLEALPDTPSAGTELFAFRSNKDQTAPLERDIIITGDRVSGARSGFDNQSGQPQVNISLDSTGGELMNRATRNNIGRRMAVLYVEQKPVTTYQNVHENGNTQRRVVHSFREEKSMISLATIQSALGNSFRITGLDSAKESSDLALLLRSGALAAPMYFAEERTVGPSLGAENITMGVKSAAAGFILIMIFMTILYKIFGLFANVALSLNLVIVVALMSIIGATLTLPGIAGIVLTIGMAVDANVLIFSRIREELKRGLSIQKAIHEGYDRAFVSIFDANLTTLIVSIILYAIGTGPVKGFAVTLSLGIITSMFTAITGTRALVNLIYGGRKLKKIWI